MYVNTTENSVHITKKWYALYAPGFILPFTFVEAWYNIVQLRIENLIQERGRASSQDWQPSPVSQQVWKQSV